MLYNPPLWLQGKQKIKKHNEQKVKMESCVCLSLHLSWPVLLCLHRDICVCLFSTSARIFIFVFVFPLPVLCVSLSSPNKLLNPPMELEASPFWCLLLFALVLCEIYSFSSLPLAAPTLLIFRPLCTLVKCATSATLFCPSLGTLARAGQWILMSSLRAHSVKARRWNFRILQLDYSWRSDTLTSSRSESSSLPLPSFSFLSATQVKDSDNCQVVEKIIRQFFDGGKSLILFR